MSVVSIPFAVELELSSGSWTDVTAGYIDGESDIQISRGAGEDRTMQTPTASFSLDNSSEDWTPGNSASTYFNKLRKGVGVRISSTYSATKRYHFTGKVTDLSASFPDFGPARLRVNVSCEGDSSLLAAYATYTMGLQENKDVDDVMTAMMVAAGSTAYSFDDSAYIIPYAYPRSNLLADLIAAAQSELNGLIFEDGQGRLRLKSSANMLGGHASPTHTWGSTIAPEGEVRPDYRNDSQFARVRMTAARLAWSLENELIYDENLRENSIPEALESGASRRFKGRFEKMPLSVISGVGDGAVAGYSDSGDDLYASISNSQTTMQSASLLSAPITFSPGMEIRIDNEVMLLTAVSAGISNRQLLTVTRAQRGTPAAAHTANAPIYIRFYTVSYRGIGNTAAALTVSATSFRMDTWQGSEIATGDIIRFGSAANAERVFVTGKTSSSGNGFNWTINITRAARGTTAQAQPLNTPVWREIITGNDQVITGNTGVQVFAADNITGQPEEIGDVILLPSFTGAKALVFNGLDFMFDVYNQAATTRYITRRRVWGYCLELADTPRSFELSLPIPYVLGVPDGPEISLPFGISDFNLVAGYAHGVLRAGRVPKPWLTVSFTANVSDNTTSILSAEIGDLVRYTGTGTWREKIDDWFRIMYIGISPVSDDEAKFTFTLAPSDLWRNPAKSWFTTFGWQQAAGTVGLGEFDVLPTGSAGWTQDTDWDTSQPGGAALPSAPNYAMAPGVANPTPGLVNVGGADMIVAAGLYLGALANNSYPANTGGIGVVFRANSTGSQKWTAYFNPTTSLVILWNTTDGVVSSAAWTAVTLSSPEIEVVVQSTRIRVYVDAAAEPIIDVVNTRFSGNTWAGPGMSRTILVGTGLQPSFRWFSAQAV